MLTVYPALIHDDSDGAWIEFPDLEGCQSFGKNIGELMENAEEALGVYIATRRESGLEIAPPSLLGEIKGEGIKTYVSTDISKYFRDTRAVKKMLSIPAWLAKESQIHNLSLSKILQEALLEKLNG